MIAAEIRVIGVEQVIKSWGNRQLMFLRAIKRVVRDSTAKLRRSVQFRVSGNITYSKGRTLHQKGTLHRSITQRFESGGLVGIVGTNIQYARIHEFGGTIREVPSWRSKTKTHDVYIPARPYMRPALNEIKPFFLRALHDATRGALGSRG